ncbi:protein translocase subunit SecD [Mycobacterium sp. 1164985.4]|uniref:protein translocase subunit SecD n=1 Tax=Mycobacterium sp. 1164985.4 TaxID=1834069 RepID=UPI0007FD92B5|nr:protein translocase subunit SecD [Mycobacterium sp. 1164985.4]OBK79577.1 protein-export membrane protein SecD [Mycobacterium sp. 1164985.4]
MASSSTPVHPARYLSLFLALLVGAYCLVFLTGDKKAEPKLGIDLQGGTRVTLTARTPDGSPPTRDALNQAQQIINDRVNGLGVSGSEVIIDGNNLVITVPGSESSEARNLGQTARLYIRPVVHVMPAEMPGDTEGPPDAPPGGPVPGMPGMPGMPGAPGAEPPAGQQPPGGDQPPAQPAPPGAPQPRPYPQEPPAQPAPPPPPPPSPAPGGPAPSPTQTKPPSPEDVPLAQRIADEKQLRQSTDQQIQILALQFQATRCNEDDVLAGNDDPNLPLITCGRDGNVYLLDKSIINGEQIQDATSGLDQQRGEYVVNLQFKGEGAKTWADFTAANVGTQTAFVLDSKVMSAPEIREAIPGGRTQISGQFTQQTARELANVLKYGSLPLSFESSEAETVSATLGLSSLRAGLIAGAVGLALVLLYSLLYYRMLGVLTALSLVASGAMVYAILVLLGRWIGYTLDLAGIAGLIIGIGMTADSFVVFFERIKDEIREGRSFRSAVPRGWARARKTIVSGNAVTLLAAAVLYVLAVGQVKGFAFTLGLTTILDVVVVFLVTWPLVYLASKSPTLAKPSLNGLGAVQQIARERRAAAHATGRD